MDCVPMLSEHAANTEITVFADKGMYHEEGGWPRDVDASEPEQKQRYLKKAEKDEDYVKSMDVQTGGIIHAMRQVRAPQRIGPEKRAQADRGRWEAAHGGRRRGAWNEAGRTRSRTGNSAPTVSAR